MNQAEEAVELFGRNASCTQAILSVFGEQYDIDRDSAMKLGRAFGGGIGHLGLTCGAVTGAVILLGLAEGSVDSEQERAARHRSYKQVGEFVRRFEALHGSIECKALLGEDISTESGLKNIQDANLFSTVCPKFVRDAAAILAEMLPAT